MIKFVSKKLGLDAPIIFTILNRVIQASGGIFTLTIIATKLSKIEQGFYYTFTSILAVQIFFELGLSNIITQFVAHENANIKWVTSTEFTGSVENMSRLSSLLRFTVKWFSVFSILLFLFLTIIGIKFFTNYTNLSNNVEWIKPWILLSLVTSFNLIVSPILAFIEGLGKVKEVAKIRMLQQVLQLTFIILFFSLGFKLYSSPFALLLSFIIIIIWLFYSRNKLLIISIWNKKNIWNVNYKKEIFPFQWKIALSWISGYFIFQLFNPVLFATEGAIVAGQMGMTLVFLNAILVVSLTWINTKIPQFSNLIAKKQFHKLNHIFINAFKQSTILNFICLLLLYILINFLKLYENKIGLKGIGERFLSNGPLFFLMIALFFNHIIASLAIYLRCHKKEPLLLQSLIIGILNFSSIIFFGKYYGILAMSIGYMVLITISLFWTLYIFKSKINDWHFEQ